LSAPQKTTPILSVDKTEERLLLQGTEHSFGWAIVLDQESGKLAATLLDNRGAIVLFGHCTPR
jgi:hypothetical protein